MMSLEFHPMWSLLFLLFGLVLGSLLGDKYWWTISIIVFTIIGVILTFVLPTSPSGFINFDKSLFMTIVVYVMVIVMIIIEFKHYFYSF